MNRGASPIAAPAGLFARSGGLLTFLFVGPFLLYVTAFLLLPTGMLLVEAFTGRHGPTVSYVAALATGPTLVAFRNSVILSAISAFTGLVFGLLAAYFVMRPGMPRGLPSLVTTFSAVAANFAGVPLAFAFIATLGSLGMITVWLKSLGLDLYGMGFSLYSLPGLVLVYAYFQIPLMVIVFLPAVDGLRKEWWDASSSLGGGSWAYWRYVGGPILAPTFLGAALLLFTNAFSAYATAAALISQGQPLVTLQIRWALTSEMVLGQENIAKVLALGMVIIVSLIMVAYSLLQRRTAKWVQ